MDYAEYFGVWTLGKVEHFCDYVDCNVTTLDEGYNDVRRDDDPYHEGARGRHAPALQGPPPGPRLVVLLLDGGELGAGGSVLVAMGGGALADAVHHHPVGALAVVAAIAPARLAGVALTDHRTS